jgi:hypothetical protein
MHAQLTVGVDLADALGEVIHRVLGTLEKLLALTLEKLLALTLQRWDLPRCSSWLSLNLLLDLLLLMLCFDTLLQCKR